MKLLVLAACAAAVTAIATPKPRVHNVDGDITYEGFTRNGVEVFLGIPYAQDTGGQNRFKPPQPFSFPPNSVVDATKPGPACPQPLGQWNAPLTLLNVTKEGISEDCLNLNIVRPGEDTMYPPNGLPVMVWIHGGSFWVGSNMEPTHEPDGLVRNSVDEGTPIIHVAINYRLGLFGFAQSGALRQERSENAGLRDQRAAIEWVRDNIYHFGGNRDRITIHGQSSGGLAVGMQLLAYGGEKELPFQQGICQSQALEPGITANFTSDAMRLVIEKVNCNPGNSSTDSTEVIACLRSKDMQTLYDASAATYVGDIAHNIGDVWLPSVDGDFLPDVPSKLIAEGRFGKATYMFGWTQDDVNFFTNISISSENDTLNFLTTYLPKVDPYASIYPEADWNIKEYLQLYSVKAFLPPPGTNLTGDFYRTARVFRDILMVCEPILLAEAIHRKGQRVYMYNFNQTLLDPIIESVYGIKGMGVVHTSEFAYIFGNLSHYNVSGYPFNPTEADYTLAQRASRSWASFAHSGDPSHGNSVVTEHGGLQYWWPAFWRLEEFNQYKMKPRRPGHMYVYTIGGPSEGLWPLDGPESIEPVSSQGLAEKAPHQLRTAIPPSAMAGTRRSTRQSATTAPKYAEPDSSVSEGEAPKRTAKKATRRKRARDDDENENVVKDSSPPPKKAARSKSKSTKPAPEPTTQTPSDTDIAAAPRALSSLEPSSPSNRDASGAQEIYWLLKAEPLPRYENGVNVAFSISDLAACTRPEPWTGVRNPLACKNMRAMRAGDLGFFYHSNAKPSGVAGILRVVEEAKVDETAFDEKAPYYDKKSDREKPRWWCVGVEFVKEFAEVVDLAKIKKEAERGGRLEGMQLVTNSRLSVSRVRREEWECILEMAGDKGESEKTDGGAEGVANGGDKEEDATADE
ncbi:alpha/beta-hydrolase [Bimuria novae-zelandiae CBS 107.79]|uniref:Thymocyte nuclear protein 1 n=1 Tax=Bimuria novae-zelandiae CBS 107.79 TaxID=1447943 RepID=A0A6A5UXD4_9PLEO|nr:alpha/beta-hydrolase [Bimuria novae-zelandiae CBS 107.79]